MKTCTRSGCTRPVYQHKSNSMFGGVCVKHNNRRLAVAQARAGKRTTLTASTGNLAEGLAEEAGVEMFNYRLWEWQERRCAIRGCPRVAITPATLWETPEPVVIVTKTRASLDHRHYIWKAGQPLDTFWGSLGGLLCSGCNAALSANRHTGPRTPIDYAEILKGILAYLQNPPAQAFVAELGLF